MNNYDYWARVYADPELYEAHYGRSGRDDDEDWDKYDRWKD